MSLTYGELFAGYGGLGMGVQSVLGGEMAWCAEFDKAPSKILAHRWPDDVPNLGDVTKVDWAAVEPVDVITGGSPCQDLSHAGKRAGMRSGTRSGLWASMCDAIDIIRPRLVVWENVGGALSAEANSALEPCPRCVGDPRQRGPVLRALGRVLGDLSELGYDTRWYGLRASDVGACHGRFRIFVFATPGDADLTGLEGRPASESTDQRPAGAAGVGPGLTLLPTPAVNDMGAGKTVEAWDAWTDRMKAAHGNGNGHGKSLAIEAQRLLKTPTAQLAVNGGSQHPDKRRSGGHGPTLADEVEHLLPTPERSDGSGGRVSSEVGGVRPSGAKRAITLSTAIAHQEQDWSTYEAAIRRHERALGRPAPPPTETGPKGGQRLSPRFVEWMMMLPEGHVTDVPGLSRNEQLKALGNGVVPAQAAAALRHLGAAMLAAARETVA